MNSVDAFILIIILIFALRGLWRGFVLELATIIGLLGGYLVALGYSHLLLKILLDNFSSLSENIARLISFFALFLVVNIAIRILASILTKMLKLAMLGWMNRLGGAIFAVGKVLIVMSILILVVDFLPFAKNYLDGFGIPESNFYPLLKMIGPELFTYFQSLTIA